ncbi:hypothetical protein [Oceanobacillus bengalensis]|uniref:hypothetical protein n=1 Tax=Oceanobacillus bengalensis TaxID=1435466 RepID=UPI0016027FF4|nr:hypothetical protein [Oceanobacillus bengalensis]
MMALGISMQGVVSNFLGPSFFQSAFAKIIPTIILAIWISFIFSIVLSYFNGRFRELHVRNAVNRFGIGTWVAASSICGILVSKHFTEWGIIAKVLCCLNVMFWIFYIIICIKAFFEIHHNHLMKNSNGIFLLTTVSTQSIILMLHTVFGEIPKMITISLLFIGLGFYLISATFIIRRYVTNQWAIETDWNNTNCILHGALSISGLVCIVSGIAPEKVLMLLWIFTLVVFLIVECLELCRIYKRIVTYGLKKGMLIYDVSQWSRVFTFAMFYTFTSLIHLTSSQFTMIQSIILQFGIWVVLLLILSEIILSVKHGDGSPASSSLKSAMSGHRSPSRNSK